MIFEVVVVVVVVVERKGHGEAGKEGVITGGAGDGLEILKRAAREDEEVTRDEAAGRGGGV
jgi:hypothetical protein